jgi:hypothetical protein
MWLRKTVQKRVDMCGNFSHGNRRPIRHEIEGEGERERRRERNREREGGGAEGEDVG